MTTEKQKIQHQRLFQASLVAYHASAEVFTGGIDKQHLFGMDAPGLYLKNANLDGSNFYGSNLLGANLESVNLQNSSLQDSNLSHVYARWGNFKGSDLEGVNFQHADLEEADLSQTNLENVEFTKAHLRRANLQGANLQNSDLENVDLNDANIYNTNIKDATLDLVNFLLTKNWEKAIGLETIKFKFDGKTVTGLHISPEGDIRITPEVSNDTSSEFTNVASQSIHVLDALKIAVQSNPSYKIQDILYAHLPEAEAGSLRSALHPD